MPPSTPSHLTKVLELIEDDHLRHLVTGFNRHLRRVRRKPTSDRTAELYNQSLRFFIGWLKDPRLQLGLPQPAVLASFTTENLNAWMDYLRDGDPEADPPRPGVSVSTQHTRYRALRRFLLYLVSIGELEKSPSAGVDLPALDDEYTPMTLEIEQLAKLIEACRVPRGRASEFSRTIFDGRRDELIIRLLGACGLRVSELCGIDIEDIDTEQQMLTVRNTKSGKIRTVAYPDAVGEAIDAYQRARRLHRKAKTTRPHDRSNPTAPPRHPLLLSERGPMSSDGVRWRLELLAEKTEIKGLHPHALRHTFAHYWLLEGGNENELKKVMGWAKGSDMPTVYGRSHAQMRAHMTQRRLAFGDKW